MTRIQVLLSSLLALLIVLIFWFLLFTPQQDELAEVEEQIETELAQQETIRVRIAELRSVREGAPAAEAELAIGQSIIPSEPGLPAALRQLQQAADESGIVLRSITSARPAALNDELGLARIALSVQLEGTYFQAVDFLRRVEDPAITPRAVLWSSFGISVAEHPELSINATGDLFTRLPPDELDELDLDDEGEVDPDSEELDDELDVEDDDGQEVEQ